MVRQRRGAIPITQPVEAPPRFRFPIMMPIPFLSHESRKNPIELRTCRRKYLAAQGINDNASDYPRDGRDAEVGKNPAGDDHHCGANEDRGQAGNHLANGELDKGLEDEDVNADGDNAQERAIQSKGPEIERRRIVRDGRHDQKIRHLGGKGELGPALRPEDLTRIVSNRDHDGAAQGPQAEHKGSFGPLRAENERGDEVAIEENPETEWHDEQGDLLLHTEEGGMERLVVPLPSGELGEQHGGRSARDDAHAGVDHRDRRFIQTEIVRGQQRPDDEGAHPGSEPDGELLEERPRAERDHLPQLGEGIEEQRLPIGLQGQDKRIHQVAGDCPDHQRPEVEAQKRQGDGDDEGDEGYGDADDEELLEGERPVEQRKLDAAQGGEGKGSASDDEHDPEPVVANERGEGLVEDPDEEPEHERDEQVCHEGDVRAAVEMARVLELVLDEIFLEARVGEHVGEARHHRDGRDDTESLRRQNMCEGDLGERRYELNDHLGHKGPLGSRRSLFT